MAQGRPEGSSERGRDERRQSRIVERGIPVARAISQSFKPVALRTAAWLYSELGRMTQVRRVGFEPTRPYGQCVLSASSLPFLHRRTKPQFSSGGSVRYPCLHKTMS